MESSVFHPLQSLTDMVTIEETKTVDKPKICLSWAPHPKALPHAVGNSFTQWILNSRLDLTICHPPGYELDPSITSGATISHHQEEALKGADYVYVKSWCMSEPYGKCSDAYNDWIINKDKMNLTQNGYFMHCLPIRRNVVVTDEVLDGSRSLINIQAENRMYAAQAVISRILKSISL
jgi:N-succinyl-L-ornithine transcarbamylase